jgi:PncC family amidohydrolase
VAKTKLKTKLRAKSQPKEKSRAKVKSSPQPKVKPKRRLETLSELLRKAVSRLRERGETISFAESCTGGLLSASVTELAGVSDLFLGSVVSYSNQVKEELLRVPKPMLQSLGAVSAPVALQMARGVRERLHSDWAIGISGIAGPGGGSPEKPVGTVFISAAGPGVEMCVREKFTGDRREIQLASVRRALQLLNEQLD